MSRIILHRATIILQLFVYFMGCIICPRAEGTRTALGQGVHGRAYNYIRYELPTYLRCRGGLPASGGFCSDCRVPSEYEACIEQCEAFYGSAGYCFDKCLASPAEGGNQLGFDVDCTRKCQVDGRKLVSDVCGVPLEELYGRIDDLFEHLIAAFDLDPNA